MDPTAVVDSTKTEKSRNPGLPKRTISKSPESGYEESEEGDIYHQERVKSTAWIQKRYANGKNVFTTKIESKFAM